MTLVPASYAKILKFQRDLWAFLDPMTRRIAKI